MKRSVSCNTGASRFPCVRKPNTYIQGPWNFPQLYFHIFRHISRSIQLMSLTSAEYLVEQRVAQLEQVSTVLLLINNSSVLFVEQFQTDAMSYFAKCTT